VAWGFGDFVPNLYPIYFCPVGTVFAFSLKMVSTVDCCVRLGKQKPPSNLEGGFAAIWKSELMLSV